MKKDSLIYFIKHYYKKFTASIVSKLTFFYALSAFLLTTIAAFTLYLALAHIVNQQNEGFIIGELLTINNILQKETEPLKLSTALEQEIILEPTTSHNHYMIRLVTTDNKILMETPDTDKILAAAKFPVPKENNFLSKILIFKAHRAKQYTLMSSYGYYNDKKVFIQAALNTTKDSQLIKQYENILLLVVLINTLFSTIFASFLTKKGMSSIKKINNILNQIHIDELDKRLESHQLPTELASTAKGLNKMLDRIEKSYLRLKQFSADLAHELRTPINNLICQTEVTIAKERNAEEYYKVLISNLEETQRLSKLIDDMLFIAKSKNPNQIIKLKVVEIKPIIESVIEYFGLLASERNISISISGKGIANVDPLLFKRAISNIISNSIKYSVNGSPITINIFEDKDKTIISIADTGVGIPEKDIPYIFERFYRVDSSRSRNQGGSGLGLAIVKSIMDLHQGEITLSSKLNQGTTFQLFFPKSKMTEL